MGELTTIGDLDLWAVALAAGQTVQIEIYAARMDREAWKAAQNTASLTVFDTDGTTSLYFQNSDSIDYGGTNDTDSALFRAPAGGLYYISVANSIAANAGGRYGVRVQDATFPNAMFEMEANGVAGSNDDAMTAEPINPGTIFGNYLDDESDYYSFTITEPTIVIFELKANRLGAYGAATKNFDPELFLYDSDGITEIANIDDAYFYDPAIRFQFDVNGTYFVEVTKCCGDAPNSPYALEFTSLPVPVGLTEVEPNNAIAEALAFPASGRIEGTVDLMDSDFWQIDAVAGRGYSLRASHDESDQGAVSNANLTVLRSDGTTRIRTSGSSGSADGRDLWIQTTTETVYVRVDSTEATPYAVDLEVQDGSFEAEPNDTAMQAAALTPGSLGTGVIGAMGDVDHWTFSAEAGEVVHFCIYAGDGNTTANGVGRRSGFGSELEAAITVLDPMGVEVATTVLQAVTDGNGPGNGNGNGFELSSEGVIEGVAPVQLVLVTQGAGTFTLRIEDEAGNGDANHTYMIERL
ncbi:MAG: hypothetical protein GY926_18380 [bacterium]|nr:hypothetical protein [bacterium]